MDNPCPFLYVLAFVQFDLPWPSIPTQWSSEACLVLETTPIVS